MSFLKELVTEGLEDELSDWERQDKYKTMGKECLIEERDSPTKYIGLSYI